MIGTTLSHYQILEKLGAGGMGVVYRAHERRTDGKELFYLSLERRVMSVSVQSDPSTFRGSVPRALFDEPVSEGSYDVSRDGQRFLINTVLPEASSPIQIVLNWRPEERH